MNIVRLLSAAQLALSLLILATRLVVLLPQTWKIGRRLALRRQVDLDDQVLRNQPQFQSRHHSSNEKERALRLSDVVFRL